jgi:hypothetical protein
MSEVQAAAQLVDAARVIAPRGARDVALQLERGVRGELRVTAVGSTAVGPTWATVLGLDAAEYVGLVHGALEQMELGGGSEVAIVWGEQGAQVTLDGGRAIAVPAAAVHRMVFAEGLLESLLAAGRELRAWHEAFSAEILGHDEAKWDSATGELKLARGVLPWRNLPARRIGTFGLGDGVFRWGWADPAIARMVVVKEGEVPDAGLGGALRTPWFPCDEAFAVRLSGWITLQLSGRGMYALAESEGTIAFYSVQVR